MSSPTNSYALEALTNHRRQRSRNFHAFNREAGRNVGFENVVRVAMVLGRTKELEGLFLPKLDSLDDIRRYENSANRHRAKRKPGNV